ncbi:MAG: hypothetical protein AAGB15_14955 [Pseudomonadota bacterium]
MFRLLPRVAAPALRGLQNSLSSTGAARAVATPGLGRWIIGSRAAPASQADVSGWNLIGDEVALRARGVEMLCLFGSAMDYDGRALQGVRLDIWQTGLDGEAVEPETAAKAPFAGHGWTLTDAEGTYRFQTILPKATASRAPHIKARVTRPGGRQLECELFLVDAPENDRDWNFGALGPSQQAAVSIDPIRRSDGDLEAGFNFVL